MMLSLIKPIMSSLSRCFVPINSWSALSCTDESACAIASRRSSAGKSEISIEPEATPSAATDIHAENASSPFP